MVKCPTTRFSYFLNIYSILKNLRRDIGCILLFVFDLVENVLRKQSPYYAFKEIEKWRDALVEDNTKIRTKDLGAGSRKSGNRKVKDIAANALSTKVQSEWLFGLVNYFGVKTIIELGTSLGVSTAYLASVRPTTKVYTFEGNPDILSIAQKGWQKASVGKH